MHILWVIIIGFFVGLVARLIMPGRDPEGFILTTLIGIVGALVGSFGGRALGMYTEGEPAGLFMSVVGAFIVLFIYKTVTGRGNPVAR